MIQNADGTFNLGLFDILCILHDEGKDRYHTAYFTEAPFPGPVPSNPGLIRLKSRGHHTEGFATFEEAQANLRNEVVKQLKPLDEKNCWDAKAIPWDGEPGIVWILPNWHREGAIRPDLVS
jgi:hypothetical protein